MTQPSATKTKPQFLDRSSIIEQVTRSNPGLIMADGESIWQAGGDRQKTDQSEASATFVIVTRAAAPNRHGNKVLIKPDRRGQGMLTENFDRNPIVLFEHGQNIQFPFPIGQARKDKESPAEYRLSKTKALAKVYFDQSSGPAMDIFRMVDSGLLNMASIGYRPLKAQVIQRKDQKLSDGVEDMTKWQGGLDFVEIDWWEFSITPLGADVGSLRQAYGRQSVGGESLTSPSLVWLRSIGANERSKFTQGADFDAPQALALCDDFEIEIHGERAGEFLQAIDTALVVQQSTGEAGDDDDVEDSNTDDGELSDTDSPPDSGSGNEPQDVSGGPPVPGGPDDGSSQQQSAISPDDLANAWDQRQSAQVSSALDALPEMIGQAIERAVEPIREEQSKLANDLKTKLGAVG